MAAAASWIGNKAFKPKNQNTALVRSTRQGHFALRPLPNEDIALWVKSIDNSRVAQQRDPKVNGRCGVTLAALLLPWRW